MLIDSRFGKPLPDGLSQMPNKRVLYACDTYFHEGWEDIAGVAGEHAVELSHEHAMLVVKPEAIVGRRMHTLLDWLAAQGFRIAVAEPFEFTPLLVRAMWFYQWNIASRERRDACDLMLAGAESVLLVVGRPAGVRVSASEHFASLKGSFDPAMRQPGELRALLRASSKQMTFVHSADEPADVARELAIVLPKAQRLALLRSLEKQPDVSVHARALCADLYAAGAPHTLLLEDTFHGLRDAVLHRDSRHSAALLAELSRLQDHGSSDWRGFLLACETAGVKVSHWDAVVLANHLVSFDMPGLRRLLPSARDGAEVTR